MFDRTSLVYFDSKLDLAMRGHSKDGHPDECQVTVGISQLAKPLGAPIGLTVMPGNTHDRKHVKATYGQVKDDLTDGYTMISDVGGEPEGHPDGAVGDGKHSPTGKRLNKSDDKPFDRLFGGRVGMHR